MGDSADMSRLFLVTGGAGFIGSSIVRALRDRGDQVRVLDDFSTGTRQNLDGVSSVEVIEGDIRDERVLAAALNGVDVVFHQAAISSVVRSVAEPLLTHEINATGTLKVLNAAHRIGVRRVVYAGSASAYGNVPILPKVEVLAPAPSSPYAASKLAGEYYCTAFHQVYGLETVSLRYFNVFGPRQDPRSEYAAVIPRFLSAALEMREAVVYGDGEQSRDFCYVEDVAAANLLAADASSAPGRVFNIASDHAVSLNQVLKALGEILGYDLGARHEAAREGDIRHSVADINLARKHLKYVPAVGLREGLAKTIDWYRSTLSHDLGRTPYLKMQ
jgi:nucleoside-diphosphate-sugar epimerase